MDRISAIQKSLAGFVCGILAFIPGIGILPAAGAFQHWLLVTRRFKGEWNPARRYLVAGVVLAILGIILGTFVPCLLVLLEVNRVSFGSSGHG